jgi:hypothetical protein
VDPCTKQVKVLYIPPGQPTVTVNYLGFIRSFTQIEFQNGTFDSWISTCQQQASSQPCDELKTQTQTNTNMVITQNIISTITSLTASATMSMSNTISNSVSNSSSQSESSGDKRSKNRNNGTNQSSSTPSGNISSNSTTPNGTSQSGGSQGNPQSNGGTGSSQGETTNQNGGNSSGSGNSTEGGSGQTQPPVTNPSSNPTSSGGSQGQSSGSNGGNGSSQGQSTGSNGGNGSSQGQSSGSNGGSGGLQGQSQGQGTPQEKTDVTKSGGGNGGTTNSVANAAESSLGNGNGGGSKVRVGSLIGIGDIVAIRSNEDGSNQFKGTMSMTKSNTNNTRAKGALLNFTTTINNSNLTLYGSFTNKKKTHTLIMANSSMVDFGKNFFNTTTGLQSQKIGKVTMMGGANFTMGVMAEEPFSNLSAVGGGFVPFKAGKKITGNLLVLGVYSPFTKFYEGKWWDSGLLLVPFSSWDYSISKNFKYNVSISGTYEVNGSVLQYQILTGGKILL